MDELASALTDLVNSLMKNDKALLVAIEALTDDVINLRHRVSQLEDLHRLEEHKDND